MDYHQLIRLIILLQCLLCYPSLAGAESIDNLHTKFSANNVANAVVGQDKQTKQAETLALREKQFAAKETATRDAKLQQLQSLLAETGFYPGQINGMMDHETRKAIQSSQRSFELSVTGQYDPRLVEILKQEINKKPSIYRKKLDLEATAYTTKDPGSGTHTKQGHKLRKGLVAVDPRVIPLGTRLYIEGYGYAIADDIGSAIKGKKIDLAYENRREALRFGRKKINVYVLE